MRALASLGVIIILVVVVVLIGKSVKIESVGGGSPSPTERAVLSMNNSTPSAELKIEDIKVGSGIEAIAGKKVSVNYVGTLTDGSKFDSSYDRNQPFTFNLGAGEVIKGWDEGVVGMKVGGKRKLTIPPDLGYGAAGAPPVIGPNATLIFEIELLDVK